MRWLRMSLVCIGAALAIPTLGCDRSFVQYTPPTGQSVDSGPQMLVASADPVVVAPRGSSTITVSGGIPPYALTIPSPNSEGPTIQGMGPNNARATYTAGVAGNTTDVVVVTDQSMQTAQVPISVGPGLGISPTSITRAPLTTWSFTISGGQPPYSIAIHSPSTCPQPSGSWLADAGCPVVDAGSGGVDAGAGSSVSVGSCVDTSVTMNGAVNYRAGSCGEESSDQLVVTDAVDSSVEATIDITTALTLEPTGAKTVPGGLVFFQATGGLAPYTFGFTTHGNRSGGTLSTGGTYLAGPNPNVTDTIEAKDAAGVAVEVEAGVGNQQLSLPTGRRYSLYSGDFNGDGFGDVVAISQGDSHPLVVTALGSATGFIATTTLSLSGTVNQVIVGDFNADGFDDLVVQPATPPNSTVNGFPQLTFLAGSGSGNFTVLPLIDEGQGVSFQALQRVTTPLYQYSANSDGFGHPGLTYLGGGGDALLVLADVEGFPDGGAFEVTTPYPDGGDRFVRFPDAGHGAVELPEFSDGGTAFPYTQIQVWTAQGAGNLVDQHDENLPASLFAQPNQFDAPFPLEPWDYFNSVGATLSQARFPELAQFPSALDAPPGSVPAPADFTALDMLSDCDGFAPPYGTFPGPADGGNFVALPFQCSDIPLPCGTGNSGYGTSWPLHLSQVAGLNADGSNAVGFNADANQPGLFGSVISLDGGYGCFPLPSYYPLYMTDPTAQVLATFLDFDFTNPQPDLIVSAPFIDGTTIAQLDRTAGDGGYFTIPVSGFVQPDGGDLFEGEGIFGPSTPVSAYWGALPTFAVNEIPGQLSPGGALESTSFFAGMLGELDSLGPTGVVRASFVDGNLVVTSTLSAAGANAFTTGDIDGDGLIDGVTIDFSSALDFIRGGPTGQPFVGTARQLHEGPQGAHMNLDVGDFDGDGISDVVVPDLGLRVFYGDRAGPLGASLNVLGPVTAMAVARGGTGAWALIPDYSGQSVSTAHADFSTVAGTTTSAQDYPPVQSDGGQRVAPVYLDPTFPIQMADLTVDNDPRAALLFGSPLGLPDGGSQGGVLTATLGSGVTGTGIGDVGVDGLPLVAAITGSLGTDLLVSVANGQSSTDMANVWSTWSDGGTLWTDPVAQYPLIPSPTSDVDGTGTLDVTGIFSVTSTAGGPRDVIVAAVASYDEFGNCQAVDPQGRQLGGIIVLGASDLIGGSATTPAPPILTLPVQSACSAQANWSVATADFDRDGATDLLVSDGQVLAIVSNLAAFRQYPITAGTYPDVRFIYYAGALGHAVAGDFNGDGWPDIAYTRQDLAELQVALFHPDAGSYY